MEWNKIDVNIRNLTSWNVFKRVILKFIRPKPSEVFNVGSSEGIKIFKRTRLGLSHLADHKFKLNFQDFFFYLSFLSRIFTIHRTSGEGEGYLFNSFLQFPPTSQTLRH